MKALLMHRAADFDLEQGLPSTAADLIQDLELDTLFNAMARSDEFVYAVVRTTVLSSSRNDSATIRYRQDVLRDCLRRSVVVRQIYDITVECEASRKRVHLGLFSKSPGSILHRSLELMELFVGLLKQLRDIADHHAADFKSDGFVRFFSMLRRELTDDYFEEIREHLKRLRFRNGVLLSAMLGEGNKGADYRLCRPSEPRHGWTRRILAGRPAAYTYRIPDRDLQGASALAELRDRGIHLVANALGQSTDHILAFFKLLRTELAFYIGCLNLHETLMLKDRSWCFPQVEASSERCHRGTDLYDPSLVLTVDGAVVANDIQADDKELVIVTGANQGGKSTFLRSIGVAQLMMQSGMFVAAKSFRANLCTDLFTHYRREEDKSMHSGKLDEELSRMSDIVDSLTPNALVLFNESFAATNEREGSEIARQICTALVERRVKMFFVTHMYDFARSICVRDTDRVLSLRAERQADGRRTFKLFEGEALQTSYGKDLYHKVFDDPAQEADR